MADHGNELNLGSNLPNGNAPSSPTSSDTSISPSDEFNNSPIKKRVSILLQHVEYRRILPYFAMWVFSGYIPAVFMPQWGAEQFNNDYNQYNIYSSIFASIGGTMGFLLGPLVGRISDSYGRKPVFYMNVVLG